MMRASVVAPLAGSEKQHKDRQGLVMQLQRTLARTGAQTGSHDVTWQVGRDV